MWDGGGEDPGHERNDGHRLGIGLQPLCPDKGLSSQTHPAVVGDETVEQARPGLKVQGHGD